MLRADQQLNGDRLSGVCTAMPRSPRTEKNAKGISDRRTDKDFIFGKLIGEGSFSSVYLAKDIHTDQEYAVKVCDKEHIKRERKVQQIIREKDIMNILNDRWETTAPYFVKLSYAFQDDFKLYFVMTFCKNGELLSLLQRVGNFDREGARFYFAEMVRAMEHLHSLHIIHRDMKPENILLDEDMHIKITDFGCAKILTKEEVEAAGCDDRPRKNSFVGTAQYVSPELLSSKGCGPGADMWALGCILYQMVSGLPPFRSKSEYFIYQKIQKLEYEFPNGFYEDAKDMVRKLLVIEPEDRLGANDPVGRYTSLRSHPLLNDLDLDAIHLAKPPKIAPFLPQGDEEVWMGAEGAGREREVIGKGLVVSGSGRKGYNREEEEEREVEREGEVKNPYFSAGREGEVESERGVGREREVGSERGIGREREVEREVGRERKVEREREIENTYFPQPMQSQTVGNPNTDISQPIQSQTANPSAVFHELDLWMQRQTEIDGWNADMSTDRLSGQIDRPGDGERSKGEDFEPSGRKIDRVDGCRNTQGTECFGLAHVTSEMDSGWIEGVDGRMRERSSRLVDDGPQGTVELPENRWCNSGLNSGRIVGLGGFSARRTNELMNERHQRMTQGAENERNIPESSGVDATGGWDAGPTLGVAGNLERTRMLPDSGERQRVDGNLQELTRMVPESSATVDTVPERRVPWDENPDFLRELRLNQNSYASTEDSERCCCCRHFCFNLPCWSVTLIVFVAVALVLRILVTVANIFV